MTLPELFIFDMDGLLFDTERLFMELRGKVLEKYGYIHREEDYIRTMGTAGSTLSALLTEIYGPGYPEQAITTEAREAELAHLKAHGPKIKPGILSLLSYLKVYQIPACVATSTTSEYAASFLKAGGIYDAFSFVLTGDQVTRSKPDPEMFLTCCRRAGVPPEHALVLEDSENGVRAAAAGHIPVICIPDLKQPSPEVRALATRVLDSAEEVPALFGFEKTGE